MAKAKKVDVVKTIDSLYEKYRNKGSILEVPKSLDKVDPRANRLGTKFISFHRYLGGGPPRGKVISFAGKSTVSKTSLALALMGHNNELQMGMVDAEHESDDNTFVWASSFYGINKDKFHILEPNYIEDAAEMIFDLSGICDAILYDGASSIGTKYEFEADMEAKQMGNDAKAYKKFFKKFRGKIKKSNTALLLTNHLYDNIGNNFEPTKEPGGEGLWYYCAQKLWLTLGNIKDEATVIGQKVNIRVVKDKIMGNRGARFTLMYYNGKGFDATEDLIVNAVDFDIIKKGGAWYSYNDSKLGQGMTKSKAMLNDNPELWQEIYDRCINHIHNNKDQFANMAAEEE